MKNIAIFISGSGTNAENIIRYFKEHGTARIPLVFSNKKEAPGIGRAARQGIPSLCFDRNDLYDSTLIVDSLKYHRIDYIVLAGFLWLMPKAVTDAYPGRILNIHPALLPSYGGKGMYGDNVHRAVIKAGERESGITIHKVTEVYDDGDIVFQARVPVEADDTPESLAARIHRLEYEHFPRVIESEVLKLG